MQLQPSGCPNVSPSRSPAQASLASREQPHHRSSRPRRCAAHRQEGSAARVSRLSPSNLFALVLYALCVSYPWGETPAAAALARSTLQHLLPVLLASALALAPLTAASDAPLQKLRRVTRMASPPVSLAHAIY
jgi:hypothetical protein